MIQPEWMSVKKAVINSNQWIEALEDSMWPHPLQIWTHLRATVDEALHRQIFSQSMSVQGHLCVCVCVCVCWCVSVCLCFRERECVSPSTRSCLPIATPTTELVFEVVWCWQKRGNPLLLSINEANSLSSDKVGITTTVTLSCALSTILLQQSCRLLDHRFLQRLVSISHLK